MLEALAEACATPGDARSKAQRMADCHAALILRPGSNDLPPVSIDLTLIAPIATMRGGDEPGEVAGIPIPGIMVRELAYTTGLLPRPTDERPEIPTGSVAEPGADAQSAADAGTGEAATFAAFQPEPTPAEPSAPVAPGVSVNEQAAADLAAMLGWTTTAGTGLTSLPTIALVDELSGQLLALTTGDQIRRAATCGRRDCRTGRRVCTHEPTGQGLGPPGDSPGYTPSDPLARYVRLRDRRCRFPGCRARAVRCDLDHTTPWPLGDTSADNLCCLCRHHHRLRHQAPGWSIEWLPDGGLQWTLPGGATRVTYPPSFGTDNPPPPTPPPLTPKERICGRPRPHGELDDDPAPF
jgi:hypothetical protein